MATKTKIQKISSKGQVTLPAAWRRKINTDQISVIISDDKLEIYPAHIPTEDERVIFDAIRDNKGKGLPIEDLIKALKEIDD